jgi:hypothetical protein
MENNSKLNPAELPFLVTHWLSNFHASNEDAANDDAVRRLQDAASQMASAFTDLGVFGTANKVSAHCAVISPFSATWSRFPVLIFLSSHSL